MIRNPFFQKIEQARSGDLAASYGGIAIKCLWYWLLCAGGVAAFFYVPLNVSSMPLLIIGAAIAIICPFLTFWFPSTSMVAGSLYSVVQGYLLVLICKMYAKEYTSIVYLAAGITILVFLLILFLYRTGIIHVNQKFRGIVLALFLASAAASTIVYVSSFFTPVLINLFRGNSSIAILVTAAALIIAVLNLVYEFDFATRIVKGGMCKKYEWMAAYGLFMSVILIFLRILELLSKVMGKKED